MTTPWTVIAAVRAEFPNTRVIVLTTFDGDEDVYRALEARAQGYLLKDARGPRGPSVQDALVQ